MEATGEQMTLFSQVASRDPANRTLKQESDLVKKMNATCGRRCLEQLERFNHVTLWGKMLAESLVGQGDWYSRRCKLTWKMRGTKYGRMYFQLAVSMPPIEGIGFGLLPTVKASDADGNSRKLTDGKNISKTTGKQYGVSINQLAVSNMLPTPQSRDYKGPQGRSYSGVAQDLPGTIQKLYPTPATRDWKGARSTEALERSGRTETNSLPDAFHQPGKTSQLNPLFLAEMMGFPPDWTELPFLNGETNL